MSNKLYVFKNILDYFTGSNLISITDTILSPVDFSAENSYNI